MAVPRHVAILGGGITGLTAAYHLVRVLPSSSKITIIEASPNLGGWVQSSNRRVSFRDEKGKQKEGDLIVEYGPRSLRPKGSKGCAGMLRMIHDLGLRDSLITVSKQHPSARNRYTLDLSGSKPILRPIKFSFNPFSGSPLSLSTLLLALSEPLTGSSASSSSSRDETIDSFLRRRFLAASGIPELVQTVLHGIYAASTTVLSAQAVLGTVYETERIYGSVLYGMLRRSRSHQAKRDSQKEDERWEGMEDIRKEASNWATYGFKGGLSTLTNRLVGHLEDKGVHLRTDELAVVIQPREGSEEVTIKTDRDIFTADHIISALPTNKMDTIPIPGLPHVAHNPYTSVGVVTLAFPLPPDRVHPAAFGYLIPRTPVDKNPGGVLGVVFDDVAMEGTDDIRLTKMTVMLGGPYWSTYPAGTSPADKDLTPENREWLENRPLYSPSSTKPLVSDALKHLRMVFPALGNVEPVLKVASIQKECIPTFLPGHYDRLRYIHETIQNGPWKGKLTLVGSGYYGVGLNDCVYMGEVVGKAIGQGQRPTGLEWVLET